jgi:hypothetical protein
MLILWGLDFTSEFVQLKSTDHWANCHRKWEMGLTAARIPPAHQTRSRTCHRLLLRKFRRVDGLPPWGKSEIFRRGKCPTQAVIFRKPVRRRAVREHDSVTNHSKYIAYINASSLPRGARFGNMHAPLTVTLRAVGHDIESDSSSHWYESSSRTGRLSRTLQYDR